MSVVEQRIIDHFSQIDPILVPLVQTLPESRRVKTLLPTTEFGYFARLTEDIIGQQLSGKVANVINARFRALFPEEVVTPLAVLGRTPDELRAVGLSWNKVRSVREAAEFTLAGKIDWNHLPTFPEEEVITQLIQIRGVGRWTAEMYLLFTLGREDVFSAGDLGLKKGMQKVFNLAQMPTPEEALSRAKVWAPYRSYASLALWWSLDQEAVRRG